MKNIMKQQNEHLLREEQEDEHQVCNCENIENCPLNGQCLTDNLVYIADVVYNDGEEDVQDTYHGSTAGPFKTRWTEHKSSFRLEYSKKSNNSQQKTLVFPKSRLSSKTATRQVS